MGRARLARHRAGDCRSARALLLLAAFLGSASAARAEAPDRIQALDPPDGAVVRSRPVFRIGYEGPEGLRPRKLRFRLTVESTREDGESYVFDQRRRRSGWVAGDGGQVLYRASGPLRDDTYRWRAWYWNGVDWVGGTPAREVRVDAVPPADVEGLRVSLEESGGLRLEWEPVSLDREGRPEYVDFYRVYRCERRKFPGGIKTLEIGETHEPRFVDDEARTPGSKILYYKVTGVDHAGNEAERPD